MYKRKTLGWAQHLDFMALDILCLELAMMAGALLRGVLEFNRLQIRLGLVVLIINLMIMVLGDVYYNVIHRDKYKELFVVLRQSAYITSAMAVVFAIDSEESSLLVVLVPAIPIYAVLSFAVRQAWKKYLKQRQHMRNHTGMLIVAEKDRLPELLPSMAHHNYDTYRFVGVAVMDDCPDVAALEAELSKLREVRLANNVPKVVATRDTLIPYLVNNWVDEVYVDVPSGGEMPVALINEIMNMGITVHAALGNMDLLEARHKNVEWVCGRATITTSLGYVTGRDLLLKRIMDIIGGLAGSLVTVLLMLILGPLIYIASPGPIFFKQTRIGENGRRFQMYKFRSMYLDAEARKQEVAEEQGEGDNLMFKMAHDPRIIGQVQRPDGTWKKGIGGWIRDLSLDEFPQFFNVLRGEMSLVGTRPPTVDEWVRYEPYHRGRMSTKPGITGLWQVSGRSKIRDFDQVVQLDCEYIKNWSLLLDFKILLRTVVAVISRNGAM